MPRQRLGMLITVLLTTLDLQGVPLLPLFYLALPEIVWSESSHSIEISRTESEIYTLHSVVHKGAKRHPGLIE